MMEVRDTSHDHEWDKVQKPTDPKQFPVKHVEIPLVAIHVVDATAHAHQVHKGIQSEKQQRTATQPPYDWIAQKVHFVLVISPAAHSKSNRAKGPFHRLGCQLVRLLPKQRVNGPQNDDTHSHANLIGIRNECIVGCVHGNVQVHEILPKTRPVTLLLSRWYFKMMKNDGCTSRLISYLHRSFQCCSTFHRLLSSFRSRRSHTTSDCLKPHSGRTTL